MKKGNKNIEKLNGKLIVIEGTDGSGKTEQSERLINKLRKDGFKAEMLDFPQYGEPSAFFIEEYLRGAYGDISEIGPYKASLFYALDRFQTSMKIKRLLKEERVIISNRYVASNMGHQGAKLENGKREKLIKWIYDTEYNILEIPKPTINFFLHVPAEISYELIGKKNQREYLHGKKRDIHEESLEHLKAAEESYLATIKIYPKDFVIIDCVEDGKLLQIEEISGFIWEKVKKLVKSNPEPKRIKQ